MRVLWKGELCSFEGKHYRVENARIYTLPDEPIRGRGRGRRARGGRARGSHGRRARLDDAGAGDRRRLSRTRAAPGRRYGNADRLLGDEREARRERRRSSGGRTRPQGHARPGAAAPEPFRAGGRDGRRGRRSPRSSSAARTPRRTRGHPRFVDAGLRPRVRAPGRARPGGLHRLLRARGVSRGEPIERAASPPDEGFSASSRSPRRAAASTSSSGRRCRACAHACSAPRR